MNDDDPKASLEGYKAAPKRALCAMDKDTSIEKVSYCESSILRLP
jgi:hypothetical protein